MRLHIIIQCYKLIIYLLFIHTITAAYIIKHDV